MFTALCAYGRCRGRDAVEIQCDGVKVLGTDRVSGMFDGD